MKLICIKCPRGCELKITKKSITGNACPRGVDYAKEEFTDPKRIVTALAKSKYGIVPVKTDIEVPKEKIKKVLTVISKLKLEKTNIGQIVVNNVLGTGANVVITGDPYPYIK
jgi:CxxC motif-containing protein